MLVRDAQQGDRAALDTLVAEAATVIRRIARSSHPADVDDVVQSALLRVVRSLADVVEPKAFYGWLTTLARNEVRGFARERRRREQVHLEFAAGNQLTLPFEAGERTAVPDLRSAVSRLPASQQALVRDRYVSGKSYAQASLDLQLPVSAIKSRLHRARTRLRKEMDMNSEPETIRLTRADVESLAWAARFRHTGNERPALSGIYLDNAGYAVGTDGHRLVQRSVPALKALVSSLHVSPNSIDALTDGAVLTVRLDEVRLAFDHDRLAWGILEHDFPDYVQVLPDHHACELTVSKSGLLDALGAIMPFLTPRGDVQAGDLRITLIVDVRSATLTLVADDLVSHIDKESASPWNPGELNWSLRLALPAVDASGTTMRLRTTVNPVLLKDSLACLNAAEVTMRFSDPNGPIDMLGETHRSLTMPVKVEGYERRDEELPCC